MPIGGVFLIGKTLFRIFLNNIVKVFKVKIPWNKISNIIVTVMTYLVMVGRDLKGFWGWIYWGCYPRLSMSLRHWLHHNRWSQEIHSLLFPNASLKVTGNGVGWTIFQKRKFWTTIPPSSSLHNEVETGIRTTSKVPMLILLDRQLSLVLMWKKDAHHQC